jgi:hypothetical protein
MATITLRTLPTRSAVNRCGNEAGNRSVQKMRGSRAPKARSRLDLAQALQRGLQGEEAGHEGNQQHLGGHAEAEPDDHHRGEGDHGNAVGGHDRPQRQPLPARPVEEEHRQREAGEVAERVAGQRFSQRGAERGPEDLPVGPGLDGDGRRRRQQVRRHPERVHQALPGRQHPEAQDEWEPPVRPAPTRAGPRRLHA